MSDRAEEVAATMKVGGVGFSGADVAERGVVELARDAIAALALEVPPVVHAHVSARVEALISRLEAVERELAETRLTLEEEVASAERERDL